MEQSSDVEIDFSEEDIGSIVSPTEYLAEKFFPLKDYQLVKIFDYHIKILDELSNMAKALEEQKGNQHILDDSEEAKKIKKKATEFSTRFSRNHLYPLQRKVREVHNILDSNKCQQKGFRETLRKKMTFAYQTALQAVQTYVSYTSIPQNMPIDQKLKELLLEIKQLHQTCENVLIPIQESVGHGRIDMLPIKCEKIMESLKQPVELKQKRKQQLKKKPTNLNVNGSLSMYQPKLCDWTLKSQVLARLKFGQMIKARNRRMNEKDKENAENASESHGKVQVLSQKKDPKKSKIQKNENIPSTSAEDVCKKHKTYEVRMDDDIETEVHRLDLQDLRQEAISPRGLSPSASKETIIKNSSKRTELRSIVKEVLFHLDVGDDVSAMAKLNQISLKRIEPFKPENVALITIRSETMEDLEERKASAEEDVEEKEATFEKGATWPFEAIKSKLKGIPLNVSKDCTNFCVSYKEELNEHDKDLEDKKTCEIISRVSDQLLDDMMGELLDQVVDNDQVIEKLFQNELTRLK